MNDWHIALTEPGADNIAEKALRNRGYQIYRPIEPRPMSSGGNITFIRWVSMMPGYLFVIDACRDEWRRLRTSPGIRTNKCFLPSWDGYATISDAAVQLIRATELELGTIPMPAHPRDSFSVGQRVKIGVGLMKGLIDSLDDRDKAVVKVMFFGRESRVKVRYDELAGAE